MRKYWFLSGRLLTGKGFHRVIEVLPALAAKYPELIYLIVGGDSPEGNIRERLEHQVKILKLERQRPVFGCISFRTVKSTFVGS